MLHDRSTHSRTEAAAAVGGLRLGRWSEAGPRLLPRLVAEERAGPVWRRPRTLPGRGRSPVVVEVGLEIDGGIVRLDEDLIGSWAVDRLDIWRTSLANQACRPLPTAAMSVHAGVRLRLVVGDAWTTGLITRPERLSAIGHALPGRPGDHGAMAGGPILAAAPRQGTLVLADRVGPQSVTGPEDLAAPLLALAARVGTLDGDPALPLAALVVTDQGLSQSLGFWNDVPRAR